MKMTKAILHAAVAACAVLPFAVNAAEAPLMGTPFNGNWAACDTPRPPIEKAGWELTFSDDFDGPRLKDKNWFTSYRAGRKDWFARMGIPSRFDDPDAHYVIEDGILKLRMRPPLPRQRRPACPQCAAIAGSRPTARCSRAGSRTA